MVKNCGSVVGSKRATTDRIRKGFDRDTAQEIIRHGPGPFKIDINNHVGELLASWCHEGHPISDLGTGRADMPHGGMLAMS